MKNDNLQRSCWFNFFFQLTQLSIADTLIVCKLFVLLAITKLMAHCIVQYSKANLHFNIHDTWCAVWHIPWGPGETFARLKWTLFTLCVCVNCLLIWEWVTVTVNAITAQYLHHVLAAWQTVVRGYSFKLWRACCDISYVMTGRRMVTWDNVPPT